MSDYRVVADTVGGAPCVIIYKGDIPLVSIWDDEQVLGIQRVMWENPALAGEVADLVHTIRSLGGGFHELRSALAEYFKERVK